MPPIDHTDVANKPHTSLGPQAFTIIELLVVVSIIAILLALLVPAMDKAISAAEKGNCAANQKNIVQQINQYGFENKRTFPARNNADDNIKYYTGNTTLEPVSTSYGGLGYLVKEELLPGLGKSLEKIACCPSLDTTASTTHSKLAMAGGNWNNTGDWNISAAPSRYRDGSNWSGVSGSYMYRGVSYDVTHAGGTLRTNIAGGSGYVLLADMTDPEAGVKFHHQTGYNRAFGDASTAYFEDEPYIVGTETTPLSDVERLNGTDYPYPGPGTQNQNPVAATPDHDGVASVGEAWAVEAIFDFMKRDKTGPTFAATP